MKFTTTGENAVMGVVPPDAPDTTSQRYNATVHSNIEDVNGNRVINDTLSGTFHAYNYLTNPLGQRKRSVLTGDENFMTYDTNIPQAGIYERLALMIGTHQLVNKVNIEKYIESNHFNHVVIGKHMASCLGKMGDVVLQQYDIPMCYLLEPIHGTQNHYKNTLLQRYYNREHPFSREMVSVYDMMSFDYLNKLKWDERLWFSGQYSNPQGSGLANYLSDVYRYSKWHREYSTIGYDTNDHVSDLSFIDINWEKHVKDQIYYRTPDDQHVIRWVKKWVYELNELESLDWTRLYGVDNNVDYVFGHNNRCIKVVNFIGKENQSYNSFFKFMTECNLHFYTKPVSIKSYDPRPYGTRRLYFDESFNMSLHVGTQDSIIPWTVQTMGYLYMTTMSPNAYKYDIFAPVLIDAPVTSVPFRFRSA
ncbi:putative coat protein [Gigaspora margarita giardia-like virus 1]|uniref:putative coat protein n=1 Tax=Gigaspora margarita giardia-like virus 1 TaxID=2082658 RepID=UPI000CE296EE|nr:putative coat protein [Gigaspora margarita giardia-like virus 1]AVA17453.1 putative coat protein [Gigaspora margarita giardia-like virus 1]